MGTRHRAALGISECSDAVAVMVSEESGAISLGVNGELLRDLSVDELHGMLEKLIVQNDEGEFYEFIRQQNESALGDGGAERKTEEKLS